MTLTILTRWTYDEGEWKRILVEIRGKEIVYEDEEIKDLRR